MLQQQLLPHRAAPADVASAARRSSRCILSCCSSAAVAQRIHPQAQLLLLCDIPPSTISSAVAISPPPTPRFSTLLHSADRQRLLQPVLVAVLLWRVTCALVLLLQLLQPLHSLCRLATTLYSSHRSLLEAHPLLQALSLLLAL
jgi:hypothetical protein